MFTRNSLKFLVLLFAVLFTGQVVQSQTSHKKVMTIDGEVTIVQGIGAVIKGDGKTLTVEFLPPKDRLPKEYKQVDLKAKDEIVMFNGKKISTVEGFDKLMETIEPGGEIKLGVKRGKDMLIVSFPKGDASSGGQMMMMKMDVDEGGELQSSININGVEYENAAVLDAGIIIVPEENKLKIAEVLQGFSVEAGDAPQKGDFIISINGEVETSSLAFQKIYDKIPDGDDVALVLSRDGEEVLVSFKKTSIMKKKTVIED